MGRAEALFVHQDALPLRCFCAICLDVVQRPVATPCGHAFCLECLHRALAERPSCPYCRAAVSGRDVREARDIDAVVQALLIYCHEDPSARCGWTGHLSELQAHLHDCPKVRENRRRHVVFNDERVDIDNLADFTEASLMALPLKLLVLLAEELGLALRGCVEKGDLVAAVLVCVALLPGPQMQPHSCVGRRKAERARAERAAMSSESRRIADLPVSALQAELVRRNIHHRGIIEKAELVRLLMATRSRATPGWLDRASFDGTAAPMAVPAPASPAPAAAASSAVPTAGAAQVPPERRAWVEILPVRQLQQLLAERGIDHRHLIERRELEDEVLQCCVEEEVRLLPGQAAAGGGRSHEWRPSPPPAVPAAHAGVAPELERLSNAELKALLARRGVDAHLCVERHELLEWASVTRGLEEQQAPAPPRRSAPADAFRALFHGGGARAEAAAPAAARPRNDDSPSCCAHGIS